MIRSSIPLDLLAAGCVVCGVLCSYQVRKTLDLSGPPIRPGVFNSAEYQRRRKAISDPSTISKLRKFGLAGALAFLAASAAIIAGHYAYIFTK